MVFVLNDSGIERESSNLYLVCSYRELSFFPLTMPEEPRLLRGCSTVSVIPSCTGTCLCREIWPLPLLKIDEPELGTWVSGV